MSPSAPSPGGKVLDHAEMARLFEEHRRDLQRYAKQHLRDTALAEDAVQETFLAALRNPNFAGRSDVRTWLTAILKHKIVDQVRRRSRIESFESPHPESGDQNDIESLLFNASGRWVEPLTEWGVPERLLESKQLWAVFDKCRELMPEQQALLFSMREVMEMSTEEICQILDITTTNFHTTLYRARLRLQHCMDKNWFGTQRK